MVVKTEFYNSILNWVVDLSRDIEHYPIVVGVNAPQGAGKTTLTQHLVEHLNSKSIRSVSLSIDDFYLTHEQQRSLAGQNKEVPQWQQRGYPGTHDVVLGTKIISKLKNLGPGQALLVPRYDKSAFGGEGDRFEKDQWSRIEGTLEVIFFEGWMLGFEPKRAIEKSNLGNINWSLIDSKLAEYDSWNSLLDGFIWLKAYSADFVRDWRLEAEQKMRLQKGQGMSDKQVGEYVAKFLPAYEHYEVPLNKFNNHLFFLIDKNRLPFI